MKGCGEKVTAYVNEYMANKSISKNIVLNCIKTLLSIIFPLITYPYIIRVLGAEGIGKINFSSSIVSYFMFLASLGVTTYSIREGSSLKDDKRKIQNFANEVFTINLITTIFALVLLLSVVILSDKLHDYSIIIIIQSTTFVFNWLGVEWIYNIYEDFLQITVRAIIVYVLSIILMLCFVKTKEDYIIYVCISVFASGGSYVYNYIKSSKYIRPRITIKPHFDKHIRSMLVLAANLIAVTVYVNADTTMIGYILTEKDVGYYTTAVRIYTIIKQVICAIIVAATPRITYCYLHNQIDKYKEAVNKIASLLVMICLPAFAGLLMTSRDIINIFAGGGFEASIIALRVIAPSILFATLGTFLSAYSLIINRKEKTVLVVTGISALVNVILNLGFIKFFGIVGAAWTTSISELFTAICFAYYSKKLLKMLNLNHVMISSILSMLLVFVVCKVCDNVASPVIRMSLSVLFSTIIVIAVYIIRKEPIIKQYTFKLMQMTKKVFKNG